MSTTAQRLKSAVIDYLDEVKPDESIAVSDANARAEIAPPVIAVDVSGVEPHSVVLAHVQRCTLEVTLRAHSGDEDEADIDSWIDQIESALNDPTSLKSLCSDRIRIDHWLYQGSEQDWDESTLEVKFSVECLCVRV
jgi:hypothetical protein